MLFSEPKIPQCVPPVARVTLIDGFSALQRAENSSMCCDAATADDTGGVSVLFSEPKIPQSDQSRTGSMTPARVSVLFSEPKIPQFPTNARTARGRWRFSALQRAENSSIRVRPFAGDYRYAFQCSSASRKFLNCFRFKSNFNVVHGFSALQRAENSSIPSPYGDGARTRCFSALQRAENSSIPTLAPASIHISDRDDHASSFLSLPGASP